MLVNILCELYVKNKTQERAYDLKVILYYLLNIQRMRYVDKQWMLSIQ